MRLSEFIPGQSGDFFALLGERTRGATRDGKPFYTCRFRDVRRTVTVMVWADSPWYPACEADWQEGQIYKLRGRFGDHERYGPQIDLHNIRPITDADRADFDPGEVILCSRFDPEAMFVELKTLAQDHIADEPLRRLVETILNLHETSLKRLPATLQKFYPFPGGLLEHMLSVTRSCLDLVEKYRRKYSQLQPPINKDLVVAGAILHDIGRVAEFCEDAYAAEPTIPGRLLGHLFLGRDLVRDTARDLGDVNPELLQMLEHLIVTHLNLPEWGSPRLPLIPESLILHHADDLDAKLEMYVRCLTRDHAPGPFTDRDPVLGRQLYKGRSV